ncbi:glycoside hydrolase superfamily [Phascolomyces articulosus]|uniref:Probable beta-glucosidase G n=1 Tax=Phascolomyces articulosus TaxID=60185 RepID=A0AAD5K7B3_9FUNG|nr:glycoside hydrolase superfamily [Phascolomyces articulosus]
MKLSASIVLLLASTTTLVSSIDLLSWDEAYVKADKLVNEMTLDQLADITTGRGLFIGKCTGTTTATTNPDFPALCLADGPLGVRGTPFASAFPAGITIAASFDKDALRERGQDMGAEFRGKGAHVQLGPAMNIARVAKAGRNWEGFGEDPFLSGVAAAETITGIQSQGVIAAAKHYIVNEQETNRMTHSVTIDDRTLHEIYLWPFARSIEAGVGTVMCSYNKINGTYACENDRVLNQILKDELDFKGWVHSDWLATHSTTKAVNNGLDMTMPGGWVYFGGALKNAVKNSKIEITRAKDMVRRIVAAWYKMRQDEGFPSIKMNTNNGLQDPGIDVQADHAKRIRQHGAASVVLLRNKNNILPITAASGIKKIAIFGDDAGLSRQGNNTSCSVVSKCDKGTLIQGGGSGASNVPYIVSPLEGITNRAKELSIEVVSSISDGKIAKATSIAKTADVTFVFAKKYSAEMSDHSNLKADNNVDKLIQAVANTNKNTIVVIHSGNAVMMPWESHPNITGILWPGLPGQETGNSLADILFGDINPSGRLPITIAKQESDYPADVYNKFEFEYTERLLVGYKHFDAKGIDPLFEFGYGLSYTTFDYTHIKVHHANNTSTKVSVQIKNSGDRDGAEIVQAYISYPEAAYEPPKLLRGFEKVFLKKGQSNQVTFQLGKQELSIWDVPSQQWVVPKGLFRIHIGASSRDIRQRASFHINS